MSEGLFAVVCLDPGCFDGSRNWTVKRHDMYASLASAEAEAEVRAMRHPGNTYAVLTIVSIVETKVVDYNGRTRAVPTYIRLDTHT